MAMYGLDEGHELDLPLPPCKLWPLGFLHLLEAGLPLSLTDASLKVTLGKDPVSCVQSGGLSQSGFYRVRNLTFVKVSVWGTLTPEVPVTAGFFAPPSHPCMSILCD